MIKELNKDVKKEKSKRIEGITLIALVITIIVLLILAGVSIATLGGNNGIIARAKSAKTKTEEAQAEEEMMLISNEWEMYKKMCEAEGKAPNVEEFLKNNFKEGQYKKEDGKYKITTDDGNEIEIDESGNITYLVGEDINNESNKALTRITVTPTEVDVNEGEEITIMATMEPADAEDTLKFIASPAENVKITPNGNSATIEGLTAGEVTITVSGTKASDVTATCTVTVNAKTPIPPQPETIELSELDIGTYVDIGITYDNVMDFSSKNTDTSSKLTGWRILDNTGSEIKVISAGCPLTYYHQYRSINVTESLNKLKDLYTIIEVNSSAGAFAKSGFNDNNLQMVFDESTYIDTSKGVHAFSGSTSYVSTTGVQVDPIPQVETLYQKIKGTKKT